jgi:beta-N-acetylhexosaminidase
LIDAIQSQGMAACGKHFPGHGDTDSDSHHALPSLSHDLARLEAVELKPFRACLHAKSMMSAHIVFKMLDPNWPATLSPIVLRGLLRDRLGYQGVVFTDDMEMKAIAEHYGYDEAVVRAIEAGCDIVLVCHSSERQNRAIEVLARAVRDGRLSVDRVRISLDRIESLADFCVDETGRSIDPTACGSSEHVGLMSRFDETKSIDPTEAWRAD